MGELENNRNAPHIRKVNQLADQIFAVNSLLVFGAKAGDNTFGEAQEGARIILVDIRDSYNNREMALVSTKLEEAMFWCEENNTAQAKFKLTEAMHWCRKYVSVLSSD